MLYQLPRSLEAATVLCRPSASNKSPYLVDVQLDTDTSIHITHNPALGCHGLIVPGAKVWVMSAAEDSKGISSKILYLVQDGEAIVCVNPAVANHLAAAILAGGYLGGEDISDICTEVSPPEHPGTRFDFSAVDQKTGGRIWVEVKNASLADTYDGLESGRSKAPPGPKVAIFPYGNKRKIDLVSPRALKHCQHLTELSSHSTKCILMYLSQRTDVAAFKISSLDTVYNRAVQTARATGVSVLAFSIRWTTEGKAYLHKPLTVLY